MNFKIQYFLFIWKIIQSFFYITSILTDLHNMWVCGFPVIFSILNSQLSYKMIFKQKSLSCNNISLLFERRTDLSENLWTHTPVVMIKDTWHLSKWIICITRCFLRFSLFLSTLTIMICQPWRIIFKMRDMLILLDTQIVIFKDDWWL